MRIVLAGLFFLLFTGCVTTQQRTVVQKETRDLTQTQLDQIFLEAQLHIFSGNMIGAERLLQKGAAAASPVVGESFIEFNLMLARVEGDLGKVEKAYKRYIDLANDFPKNEEVLREVAQFLYGVRLKQDSYALYSRLVKINPEESNYWIYRGLLALELADTKEAWDSFNFLIKKSKDAKHLGHLYMGKLMQMTGFPKKANREFQKCLRAKSETKDCVLELTRNFYASGSRLKARKRLKRYLSKYKVRGNRELAEQLIDWYVQSRNLKAAVSNAENLERANPSDLKIKRRLAVLMAQNKDYESAAERLKIVIGNDHAVEDDHLNYVEILKSKGAAAEAYRYISSITGSPLSKEKTFFKKYELDKQVNGFSSALKSFRRTCRSAVNKTDCDYTHSYVLWESGDHLKARKKLEKVMNKNIEHPEKIKYFLSQIYYNEGKEKKSMALIDEVLLKNREHTAALNFKAYHLVSRGLDIDEAEALALRAVALRPRNGHYLDTYGYILLKRESFREAAVILKEAVKLNPSEPEILEHLADAYVGVSNIKEASKFYRLASGLYTGENQDRVGGKLAEIRSNKNIKRSISSVSSDTDVSTK